MSKVRISGDVPRAAIFTQHPVAWAEPVYHFVPSWGRIPGVVFRRRKAVQLVGFGSDAGSVAWEASLGCALLRYSRALCPIISQCVLLYLEPHNGQDVRCLESVAVRDYKSNPTPLFRSSQLRCWEFAGLMVQKGVHAPGSKRC